MAEPAATGAEAGAPATPIAVPGSATEAGEAGRMGKVDGKVDGKVVGKFDRAKPPHDWRFFVGGLGKVLIAVGVLMFGFVAYQLWGTGIETARAQNSLESEFDELLAEAEAQIETTPDRPTTTLAAPVDSVAAEVTPVVDTAVPVAEQVLPPTVEGDPLARLEIPRIGVDWIVVAGVEQSDLKKGPGHYPETPLPGQLGNAAIAGHRTTYGQPFYSIEQLAPGDEIITTTPSGRFVYTVTGTQIVSPDDYLVITTTDPSIATLTLTSCHPRWTTSQRIVVTSQLDESQSDPVGEPVVNYGRPLGDEPPAVVAPSDTAAATTAGPAPATSAPVTTDPVPTDAPTEADPDATIDEGIADAFAEGWFSDPEANVQVALWGTVLALIGLGSYLISRRTKHDSVGALVGIVPFAIALYFFFQNVNRLLPPNL